MQIYEVKNDIADILYATLEQNLYLSDFLFIEDDEQTIIAQITDISTTERADINIATVKFYLSVDKNNKLTPYDGHTPAKDADVGYIDSQEIIGLFRPKSKEIVWGNHFRDSKIKISTDLKFLSSNACIICDKAEPVKNLVNNILISLDKNNVNSIAFDFEGKFKSINNIKRLTFGKDYRIPLDIVALEYIFNNELGELPLSSKALAQNIILEIEKYIDTIPDGFIPFDIFSQIVAQECQKSKDSGLLIFSNKLTQYGQRKIFANELSEFRNIDNLKGSSIIDISDIDVKFHKMIFNSVINTLSGKFYLFSDISSDNANNEIIKRIYEKNNIRLVPISKYSDKCLSKINQYSNNYILFSPSTDCNDIPYGSFLSKLTNNDFIICGESTLFIPFIATLEKMPASKEEQLEKIDEITIQDLDDLESLNLKAANSLDTSETQETENEDYEISEPEKDNISENTDLVEETETENNSDLQEKTEDLIQIIYPNSIKNEVTETKATEVVDEEPVYEELEQISEESESNEPVNTVNIQNTVPNNENTAIGKQKPNAAELPIYTPKEVQKEVQSFENGNRVNHAKYGTGIIEKVMKYGNKTLCCIQFDKVGRKLLDPSITQIEKIF